MKIAYVYMTDLVNEKANVNQTFNMLNSFGEKAEVDFISAWISKNDLKKRLNFFALPQHFSIFRLPTFSEAWW